MCLANWPDVAKSNDVRCAKGANPLGALDEREKGPGEEEAFFSNGDLALQVLPLVLDLLRAHRPRARTERAQVQPLPPSTANATAARSGGTESATAP